MALQNVVDVLDVQNKYGAIIAVHLETEQTLVLYDDNTYEFLDRGERFSFLLDPADAQHGSSAIQYLHSILKPSESASGLILIHDPISPTRRTSNRGFRIWATDQANTSVERCPCGWAPELGQHYRERVTRLPVPERGSELNVLRGILVRQIGEHSRERCD